MSTIKAVFLKCDRCGAFADMSAIPSARSVVEARQTAHRTGWRHLKNGEDVCPECYRPPAGYPVPPLHVPRQRPGG